MSATTDETKTGYKGLKIDPRLHALLKRRSDLTGINIQRMAEDRLWSLFPSDQPTDVRERLAAYTAAAA